MGSSSFGQALGKIIEAELEHQGQQVTRKFYVSAGFARPDFRDVQALLDDLPLGPQTESVFIYLGTNDAQAIWLRPEERTRAARSWVAWRDKRWAEVYRARVQRFVDTICERGAGRAIVLLPVDVAPKGLQKRLSRIRQLQAEAAQRSSCGVAVSTSESSGGLAHHRQGDGVHLNRSGARALWLRIRQRVQQAIAAGVGVAAAR